MLSPGMKRDLVLPLTCDGLSISQHGNFNYVLCTIFISPCVWFLRGLYFRAALCFAIHTWQPFLSLHMKTLILVILWRISEGILLSCKESYLVLPFRHEGLPSLPSHEDLNSGWGNPIFMLSSIGKDFALHRWGGGTPFSPKILILWGLSLHFYLICVWFLRKLYFHAALCMKRDLVLSFTGQPDPFILCVISEVPFSYLLTYS